MRALWWMSLLIMVSAMDRKPAQAQSMLIPATAGPRLPVATAPVCVAAGPWKGTQKTSVLTGANGHERMYGWLHWERPAKWTGRRCEANWWIFASLDGGAFRPIMARQDFLDEGQQASLAVAPFSPTARWAAADVMTRSNDVTAHGYFSANLLEHTSCFGSALKGLDGVREELSMGGEPWHQQLLGVRDDGALQLSVDTVQTANGTETGGPDSRPGQGPLFDPCSGRVKIERAR